MLVGCEGFYYIVSFSTFHNLFKHTLAFFNILNTNTSTTFISTAINTKMTPSPKSGITNTTNTGSGDTDYYKTK